MHNIKFVFVAAVLGFISLVNLAPIRDPTDWDYFVYTQQWPQGACIDGNSKGHICVIPQNTTSWTVHGLWPNKKGTKGPGFCNKSEKFNFSQVKALEPLLRKYWPNMYAESTFDHFWKHEWEKHGTCAETDSLVKGEYNYFNAGLKLNRQFDLLSLLEAQGVKPDATKTYNASDVNAAIQAALGTRALLRCAYDHTTKTHHIMELEMCVDKKLQKMDCPTSMFGSPETCPETKPIYYQPIQHSGKLTIKKEGNSINGEENLVYRSRQKLSSSSNNYQLL